MKLADWLRAEGRTRSNFASQIGLSKSYVTELCKDDKWPSRNTVRQIREATNGMVSADDFIDAGGETA